MDEKRVVATSSAPTPIGPYSQAVAAQGLLFVSGQVGLDPGTGEPAGNDIESQTEQALRNLLAVAEAGGASPEDAVRVGAFLADMELFDPFNRVYERLLPEPRPARITVAGGLGKWLVEVDGVFRLGKRET